MGARTVFKRYELKYLLTRDQKDAVSEAMKPHMQPDIYGRTTIRNLYFDTDNYRLIRHSIEKPVYKEKLRIRSYAQADADSPVFVELKKKFDCVVYKRRIEVSEQEAMAWLCEGQGCAESQISREIDYFLSYYGSLHPTVFLSYDREAYYNLEEADFRVTFDGNILCRQEDLSLRMDVGGAPLLPEDTCLMEIKCSGGIPLWMTHVLAKEKIYKTSFSKYGTAYEKLIYPKLKEEALYA